MKSVIIIFFKILLCLIVSSVLAFISLFALITLMNFCSNINTKEVNGLTWGTENQILTGKLEETKFIDETHYFVFTLLDTKNNPVFTKKYYINTDLLCASFFRAMQIDDDPELEAVFYTNCHYNDNPDHYSYSDNPNFYIDIKNGKVETNDFVNASSQAKQLAEIRLFTGNKYILTLIGVFLFPIIAFIFFIYINRYFGLPRCKFCYFLALLLYFLFILSAILVYQGII
jgi:hypothetical protein